MGCCKSRLKIISEISKKSNFEYSIWDLENLLKESNCSFLKYFFTYFKIINMNFENYEADLKK